jgi:coenzyme F420-reducing hydrogenase beta subunit
MQPDQEGFSMPVVDHSKCIDCGKCDKACPWLNIGKHASAHTIRDFDNSKAVLYYSKRDRRKYSASGGFVYDLYMKLLSEGGIACGCIWDNNVEAIHIVSDLEEDVEKMQSSKYVQSNLRNCYTEIRTALKADKKVVFCGTPCQTAGLWQFLGKSNTENLISVCLLCHGVPSPEVWERYKRNIERKYQGKIIDVNMRDKYRKGYKTSYARYALDRKNGILNLYKATYLEDPYIFLFTDDLYLRKSCYHCPYKGSNSRADIIAGDFYASAPGAGRWGCNCVISLTPKGDRVMSRMEGVSIKSDIYTVGSVNTVLWKSATRNSKRREFFDRMKQQGNDDMSLFDDFLPLRFQIKKLLYKMGLFHIIRKLIK